MVSVAVISMFAVLTLVMLEPSNAGKVPVRFAAGKFVSDSPDPLKLLTPKYLSLH